METIQEQLTQYSNIQTITVHIQAHTTSVVHVLSAIPSQARWHSVSSSSITIYK